jgi:hypothetical protein
MDSSDQIIQVLRHEFDAEDGSFLIQLRCDLEWDKTAFARLVHAMHSYVSRTSDEPKVERWIANGFWYLDMFVRDWTQHPNFPRVYPAEYYESAYRRLRRLAYWLFVGESPCLGGTGFGPL